MANKLAETIKAAVESWVNRPWPVLPGPHDMAPQLVAHLTEAIRESDWNPADDADPPVEFKRCRWLRIMKDGELWMETSSPSEIRSELREHPELSASRLWERETTEFEWRPVTAEELAADCEAEDRFYGGGR